MKLVHLAIIIWVCAAIVVAYGAQNHENPALWLGGFFLACGAGLFIASLFEDNQ